MTAPASPKCRSSRMIEQTPPPTDTVRLKFHPWQPADGHLGLHPDLPGNGTTSRDGGAGRTRPHP
jgi:hypothetical protein